MTDADLLLKLAYVITCIALTWAMVCRVNRMSAATTKVSVRAVYTVVATVIVGAMSLPFWRHDWAEWGALALGLSHLTTTVANSKAWRFGPPEHARSKPAAFDDAPHHHSLKGHP